MARRVNAKEPADESRRERFKYPADDAEAQGGVPSLTLVALVDGEPIEIGLRAFVDLPGNIAGRVDAGMTEEAAQVAACEDYLSGMVRLQEIAMAYGPLTRLVARK